MSKADQSKFELENVDLKGFKAEKKSQGAREREEMEFESASSGQRVTIPRPPSRGAPGMKKSGSLPKLQDAGNDDSGNIGAKTTEEVLTAAKGLLMKGKKSKEAGDESEEEERKPRPLGKKTPSIQALYQSQEIETEFKMVLPPKEEGPTKLVLQLPGLE